MENCELLYIERTVYDVKNLSGNNTEEKTLQLRGYNSCDKLTATHRKPRDMQNGFKTIVK